MIISHVLVKPNCLFRQLSFSFLVFSLYLNSGLEYWATVDFFDSFGLLTKLQDTYKLSNKDHTQTLHWHNALCNAITNTHKKNIHFAHQAFCLDFLQNHIIYKREWQAITKLFIYYGWSKKRHNFLYHNLMWPTRVFGSLHNRAAGRLRTAESRKNVAWDCALPFLCEIFSSFCRLESSSCPVT